MSNSNFEDNSASGWGAPAGGAAYNHGSNTVSNFTAQENWWGSSAGPVLSGGDNSVYNLDYSNPRTTSPVDISNCPLPSGFPPLTPEPTPMPTSTPLPTTTLTPTFTSIDLYENDIELQGVMFWVTFWELSEDTYDSGSPVDADLGQRYTAFLFDEQQAYCSPGANPPSDNAAENIIVGDPIGNEGNYWLYIKHCPQDHRFMFARTMLNGFLNTERQHFSQPLLSYVTTNYWSVMNDINNSLWAIPPCQNQGSAGENYGYAKVNGTAAEWLHGYMNCVGMNPDVNVNELVVARARRAYLMTILPQIQQAISNFYDLSVYLILPMGLLVM